MTVISDLESVPDFFVSYTAADAAWAEWIAWQLGSAGYSVTLQAWDFIPGRDFLHEMEKATSAHRTIAVLSEKYNASAFGEAEWRAAFVKDPTGEKGLLVPVMVTSCTPPNLLASRVYIDMTDKSAQEARDVLLNGIRGRGARPTREPAFPGERTNPPMFPGDLGPRHETLRLPARGPAEFPEGRTAVYFSTDPVHGAAFSPDRYDTIREFLDDLYSAYLSDRFSPFSYGNDWILCSGERWLQGGGERCIAPLAWLTAIGAPMREVARDWQGLSPAEAGIYVNRGLVVRNPLERQYLGVISDDAWIMETLGTHPKAFYLVANFIDEVPSRILSPHDALGLARYEAIFTSTSGRYGGQVIDLRGEEPEKYIGAFFGSAKD